jgi:hypothetical protein
LKHGGRSLKKKLFDLLNQGNLDKALVEIGRLPPRQTINPLLSFIQSGNEKIKWGAVKAMGVVVSQLADLDLESARVIMRRLMWSLNDESGGIGWGSPEAMGEILATHRGLAHEYAHILLSYAREDGNYLEHEDCSEAFVENRAGSLRKGRACQRSRASLCCHIRRHKTG